MKIKVAKYIAQFLTDHGVEHMFTVTGGGAMHLNDAFGHQEGMTCVYNHHEQACSLAAEGYTRLTGKIAGVCVTTGPGGTNALTGVVGAHLDSVPMFVISGQVKRETTVWSCPDVPLRQLGDQEFTIIPCVESMTKYAHMITDPTEIRYHLEKAWYLCQSGRGGAVWLDVPLDVQASIVETEELKGFSPEEVSEAERPVYDESLTQTILEKIAAARRPVIMAGSGIRLAGAHEAFIQLAEKLQIPVVTAFNAQDVLWEDHPLFAGHPATIGTRGGNFVTQNSDLMLILGCRMNLRQIGYNTAEYAPDTYKIWIDIDEAELHKPTIQADMPIVANVKDVIASLLAAEKPDWNFDKWISWCRKINTAYPACLPEYYEKKSPVNPYVFTKELFDHFGEEDVMVCGNATAAILPFQVGALKKGQRMFSNSAIAAMGYGFPAAIGACVAQKGKRVICFDGDGSFQMNLQELQTVVYNRLNLKLFYLNNNGYHSIRQTQMNTFNSQFVGICDGYGLSFPEAEKLAYAYGIPYVKIDNHDTIHEKAAEVLSMEGPVFCEVVIDPEQMFWPKISSKVLPDGKIVSPPIDDMFPFLPREEYEAIKAEAKEI